MLAWARNVWCLAAVLAQCAFGFYPGGELMRGAVAQISPAQAPAALVSEPPPLTQPNPLEQASARSVIAACSAEKFHSETISVEGRRRQFWWKAPSGSWNGAVIAMHGGGGTSGDFCSQTHMSAFSNLALENGLAVFSINSTHAVTDAAGHVCGKVWDDEVRTRRNIDLTFIERIIATEIPSRRPDGSSTVTFLTGHSSGGYMAVRAATHFNDLITAVAPVSSGDPYGRYRDCNPTLGMRGTGSNAVYGKGYDLETHREIATVNSSLSPGGVYPHEKPWETSGPPVPPSFMKFHAENDGIEDFSVHNKLIDQLVDRGYSTAVWIRPGDASRTTAGHAWQESYNRPMVNFFLSFSTGAPPERD